MMSDYNVTRAKLTKIKKSIHFPGDEKAGLPYLGRDVAACTTVIKSDACHLAVDERIQAVLTDAELINWCRTIHPLYPLNALGRGNQFLPAVSLGLWSIVDGANVLRRLLFVFISEFAKDPLYERWTRCWTGKNQTTVELDFQKFIDMTRWQTEGEEISSAEADSFPLPLHLFTTANVLRRPIVVIGDEKGAFTGLYLPVLWKAEDCVKWPLVIAWHKGVFYPLVGQEVPAMGQRLAEVAVPLVSSRLQPLKMHFLLEEEEKEAHSLLQNYLKITELNMTRSSDICLILSAKLKYLPLAVDDITESGAAEITESSTDVELVQQNDIAIGNGVVPSAPTASLLSLHNVSDAEPFLEDEERDTSMLQETCRYPGCDLFASRFTQPFCWQHVEPRRDIVPVERLESARPHEEPVDVSVVNERCREPRCPNFASRFIYPYCYEHIDRKTVENIIRRPPVDQFPAGSSVVLERCNHGNCRNYASQYIYPFCYEHIDEREILGATPTSSNLPSVNHETEISMMIEQCIHPNCHNHASKYTFPVCYEHLDSPLAISRAAVSTRVVQLPHPAQTSVVHGQHTLGAAPNASQVVEVDKKFQQIMKELEARTKRSVPRCLNTGCANYGNSRSRGYCHGCYKLLYPV